MFVKQIINLDFRCGGEVKWFIGKLESGEFIMWQDIGHRLGCQCLFGWDEQHDCSAKEPSDPMADNRSIMKRPNQTKWEKDQRLDMSKNIYHHPSMKTKQKHILLRFYWPLNSIIKHSIKKQGCNSTTTSRLLHFGSFDPPQIYYFKGIFFSSFFPDDIESDFFFVF